MAAGIYKIENVKTKKLYIGSTRDFANRKGSHKFSLRRDRHHSAKLQKAWNEDGEENFVFEIIEYIKDLTTLFERERYYRDFYKSEDEGYNIKHDEEHREKLINSNKNRVWTDEMKAAMSKTKKELYAAGMINMTEEHKKKLSDGQKKYWTEDKKKEHSELIKNWHKDVGFSKELKKALSDKAKSRERNPNGTLK